MVRDKGLPIHREDVTVHRAHPGHRLVVQVEHLESEIKKRRQKNICNDMFGKVLQPHKREMPLRLPEP